MTSFVDKKFINLVSGQLSLFKWKSGNLANCRCPICGDSQKNKTKCRGYFYEKNNSFFYRCHNCGFGSNIKNFLEKIAPSLASEYSMETFEEKFGKKKKTKKKEIKMDFVPFKTKHAGIVFTQKISVLNDDHECKQFVMNRKIPTKWHDKLFYVDDFNEYASIAINEEVKYPSEPRLVIPFTDAENKIYAAQGRRITDGETPKYFTAKPKDVERLWFNQWTVDTTKPIHVVEGPIDCMFLSNSVALVGSGAITNTPSHFEKSKLIYVLDNEPRNSQIVSYMETLCEKGKTVCVWPSNIKEKDINEMVLGGMDASEVESIINENSYYGLQAHLKIKDWKKI